MNNWMLLGGAALITLWIDWETPLGLFGGALVIVGAAMLITEELDTYLQRRD